VSTAASSVQPRINSAITGFSVRDMNAALAFYTAKLGFKVSFKNGAVFAIVSRDGIEISLAVDRSGTATGKGACYLKVTGVDALHEELLGQGVAMAHPLKTESYGMREFMVKDPDGNGLNFGEPVKG
jgi:catechol 2,3-dioxygenase-like lactoylglutathione lyase family enzyme